MENKKIKDNVDNSVNSDNYSEFEGIFTRSNSYTVDTENSSNINEEQLILLTNSLDDLCREYLDSGKIPEKTLDFRTDNRYKAHEKAEGWY